MKRRVRAALCGVMFVAVAVASTGAAATGASSPDEPPKEKTASFRAEFDMTKQVNAWRKAGTPLTQADVEAWVDGGKVGAPDVARAADRPYPGLAGATAKAAGAAAGKIAKSKTVWKGPSCGDKWFDGDDVYVRGSASWFKVGKRKKVVTFATKMLATAHGENDESPGSDDCSLNCDAITKVGISPVHEGNPKGEGVSIYDWAPYTSETIEDQCRDITVTATFDKASMSQSRRVCPEKLSPWSSDGDSKSGARWSGKGTTGSRGAHAVAVGVWDKKVSYWDGHSHFTVSWT